MLVHVLCLSHMARKHVTIAQPLRLSLHHVCSLAMQLRLDHAMSLLLSSCPQVAESSMDTVFFETSPASSAAIIPS